MQYSDGGSGGTFCTAGIVRWEIQYSGGGQWWVMWEIQYSGGGSKLQNVIQKLSLSQVQS